MVIYFGPTNQPESSLHRAPANAEISDDSSGSPASLSTHFKNKKRLNGQLTPVETRLLLRSTGDDEAGLLLRQIMVDQADLPSEVLGENQDDPKKIWRMVEQEPDRLMALLLQGLPRINPDQFPMEHLWVMNIMASSVVLPEQKEEFKRLIHDTLINHAPSDYGDTPSTEQDYRILHAVRAHRLGLSCTRDPEEALSMTEDILRSHRNSQVQSEMINQLFDRFPNLRNRSAGLQDLLAIRN